MGDGARCERCEPQAQHGCHVLVEYAQQHLRPRPRSVNRGGGRRWRFISAHARRWSQHALQERDAPAAAARLFERLGQRRLRPARPYQPASCLDWRVERWQRHLHQQVAIEVQPQRSPLGAASSFEWTFILGRRAWLSLTEPGRPGRRRVTLHNPPLYDLRSNDVAPSHRTFDLSSLPSSYIPPCDYTPLYSHHLPDGQR